MLPKAHLTSYFRMSGSRWVITPSWLSRSLRPILYSFSVYSFHLFLISSACVRSLLFCKFFCHSGAVSNHPLLFPGSILDTFWLGGVIFWCHIFFLFYTVYGFLRREYSSGLPFPSPVDHVLSEFSTMTCPFWVVPQSVAHYFIKLQRLWSPWWFWLAFCDCGFSSGGCGIVVLVSSLCPLMDENNRLMQAFWCKGLAKGKTGSCSGGQAMLSKYLIQFSADG